MFIGPWWFLSKWWQDAGGASEMVVRLGVPGRVPPIDWILWLLEAGAFTCAGHGVEFLPTGGGEGAQRRPGDAGPRTGRREVFYCYPAYRRPSTQP